MIIKNILLNVEFLLHVIFAVLPLRNLAALNFRVFENSALLTALFGARHFHKFYQFSRNPQKRCTQKFHVYSNKTFTAQIEFFSRTSDNKGKT